MVIGGTGFIGTHVVSELMADGHQTGIIAMPPPPDAGRHTGKVRVTLADIKKLSDGELEELMVGYDAFVYAAGADDRTIPKKPALAFFREANVDSLMRLITSAIRAGLHSGLVMGSYYTHFNRLRPEMKLADCHPYIQSRAEQQHLGFEKAGENFRLMFLELPFIFGSVPGSKPLWKPLVSYLNSGWPVFCPAGGTSVVSVKTVAAAAVAALLRGKAGGCYPVGEDNLTWDQLFRKLIHPQRQHPPIHPLPAWLMKSGMRVLRLLHLIRGKESGLDMRYLPAILLSETYLDLQATAGILGYDNRGMDDAYQDTIIASHYT